MNLKEGLKKIYSECTDKKELVNSFSLYSMLLDVCNNSFTVDDEVKAYWKVISKISIYEYLLNYGVDQGVRKLKDQYYKYSKDFSMLEFETAINNTLFSMDATLKKENNSLLQAKTINQKKSNGLYLIGDIKSIQIDFSDIDINVLPSEGDNYLELINCLEDSFDVFKIKENDGVLKIELRLQYGRHSSKKALNIYLKEDYLDELSFKSTSASLNVSGHIPTFNVFGNSTSGDIVVDSVIEGIDVRTTSGDIVFCNVLNYRDRYVAKAQTVSGDINIGSFGEEDSFHTFNLKTVSGDINMSLKDYERVDRSLKTVSGNIEFFYDSDVEIIEGYANIVATSVSGNITIENMQEYCDEEDYDDEFEEDYDDEFEDDLDDDWDI